MHYKSFSVVRVKGRNFTNNVIQGKIIHGHWKLLKRDNSQQDNSPTQMKFIPND